jgi:Ni,Fe-hydrogenase III small subunit
MTEEQRLGDELRTRALAVFGRSLHIRTLDTGSCAVCESEIRLLAAPHYDLHRLGFFFTPAPRHADVVMISGPAVRAMDVAVRKTLEAVPDPKITIAVGACALGGVWTEDEFVHGSVDRVVPVDVHIPGCPPSPLALLHGLLLSVDRLQEKVSALSLDLDSEAPA